MANQANYSKIGFAVVAGAAAIVLTLVYLGGALGKGEVVYAETYSDAPVSGLSEYVSAYTTSPFPSAPPR